MLSKDDNALLTKTGPGTPMGEVFRRYWIPVWSIRQGQVSEQKVLQYPCCVMVVSPDYARFFGVVRGLSSVHLSGEGWAVGVMLQPAAGFLITRRPVHELSDRSIDVASLPSLSGDWVGASVAR